MNEQTEIVPCRVPARLLALGMERRRSMTWKPLTKVELRILIQDCIRDSKRKIAKLKWSRCWKGGAE